MDCDKMAADARQDCDKTAAAVRQHILQHQRQRRELDLAWIGLAEAERRLDGGKSSENMAAIAATVAVYN